MTNAVTLLRVLPMNDRDKDIEILALRHQLLLLHRQVGTPTFTPTDRVARRPAPPAAWPETTPDAAAGAAGHDPALAS
jgi:hypothetical protein